MYIDLTPLEVKRFEKENNISFLSLFYPSMHNVVVLISLLGRVSTEEAIARLAVILKTKTIHSYMEGVIVELERLGYLSFILKDDESQVEPPAYFFEVWDEGFADALQLSVSSADYWSLPPKVVIELCRRHFEDKKRAKQDEVDTIVYTSKLMALAYHAPKKLPKKPPELFAKSAESQTLEEQAALMQRLKKGAKANRLDSGDDEL